MKRLLFFGLVVCVLLVMAGCKTTPKTRQALHQPHIVLAEEIINHTKALQAQPNWAFQGRVAVKQGNDGGSARIDWLQRGDTMRIDLSAPITRKSVRISAMNGQTICIDGLETGRVCGAQVQEKLSQTIGEIPLFMLKDWVRGLEISADKRLEAEFEPPIVRYNDDGQLEWLAQQGWQVHYQTWHPATDTQPRLPKRLEALKDDIRLRLVIDRWIWGDDE